MIRMPPHPNTLTSCFSSDSDDDPSLQSRSPAVATAEACGSSESAFAAGGFPTEGAAVGKGTIPAHMRAALRSAPGACGTQKSLGVPTGGNAEEGDKRNTGGGRLGVRRA